jgi:hypothetical protein
MTGEADSLAALRLAGLIALSWGDGVSNINILNRIAFRIHFRDVESNSMKRKEH